MCFEFSIGGSESVECFGDEVAAEVVAKAGVCGVSADFRDVVL